MEDIVGTVADKAGISETKAKLAVAAVVDKLDGVLPGPIAGQVKSALGIDAGGMMGSMAGDLLGGDDNEGGGGLADAAKGLLGDDDEGGGLGGIAKGILGK